MQCGIKQRYRRSWIWLIHNTSSKDNLIFESLRRYKPSKLCQKLIFFYRIYTCIRSLDFFLLFFILFSIAEFGNWYRQDIRQAIFIKDESHYLNVATVGTHIVNDIFDCTLRCLGNPHCLSLNMAASKEANGKIWCELLSSEKYSKPEEYKVNSSSHHFSIKVGKTFENLYTFKRRCESFHTMRIVSIKYKILRHATVDKQIFNNVFMVFGMCWRNKVLVIWNMGYGKLRKFGKYWI